MTKLEQVQKLMLENTATYLPHVELKQHMSRREAAEAIWLWCKRRGKGND